MTCGLSLYCTCFSLSSDSSRSWAIALYCSMLEVTVLRFSASSSARVSARRRRPCRSSLPWSEPGRPESRKNQEQKWLTQFDNTILIRFEEERMDCKLTKLPRLWSLLPFFFFYFALLNWGQRFRWPLKMLDMPCVGSIESCDVVLPTSACVCGWVWANLW